jgi:triacylglycerol lipase
MNIILAHGILGFDKVLGIEYFNGIKRHLESKYEGVKVLTTAVDPTDRIETRGEQLREQILTALGQTGQSPFLNPDEETHIIAHSMGGLDSRYILSPDNEGNIAEFITSLTTVGTPHKGSPVADLVYKMLDGKAYLNILSVLEETVIASLAFLGISNEGLRDLTTEAMKNFNGKYDDNIAVVRYFWATGIGRSTGAVTSALFLPTHEYIRFKGESADDRKSDGVVPLSSAKREVKGWEQVGDLWHADHADEVGHNLDNYISPLGVLKDVGKALKGGTGVAPPPSPEILAHYDEIIARIAPLKKS